jgi:heme A synthase
LHAGLLASLVVVACSGAVTALGDTLFPIHGARLPPSGHFLVQLRVVHPILACLVMALGVVVAVRAWRIVAARSWALGVGCLCGAQLLIGLTNIALDAPGWLQLLHLLVAQLLWISAVMLAIDARPPSPLVE